MATTDSHVEIELAGVKLGLQFRTRNLMALQRMTGLDPIAFLERADGGAKPSGDEKSDRIRRGLRVSSVGNIVPLVAAGLAHHAEYAALGDDGAQDRVCVHIDAEAEKRGTVQIVVAAELARYVIPAFRASIIPPGALVDGPDGDEKGVQPHPLPEAGVSDSVGTG